MAKKKPSRKFSKISFKKPVRRPKIRQKYVTITVVGLAVIMLGISGWAWWTKIVISPERVLSDAISNSLQTTSVTRKVSQDDGAQKVNQTSYLSFYPKTITAETSTELSQKGAQRQETKITTNTIGTKEVDFVRYSAVEGAENLPGAENFKKLIGIWAKKQSNPQAGEQASFLNESLFSIMPIGNLSANERQELLDLINQKGLYEYRSAERKVENYRAAYVYQLSIQPADLIEVLAKYAQITGAVDPKQFDPAVYANAPAVSIQMTVDIASRKITKIKYGNTNRTETFSSYNLYRPIELPGRAITIEELQNLLQNNEGQTEAQSS